MGLFNRKINLGMTIDSGVIRLVCLEKVKGSFILIAAREVSIPQSVVSGGVVIQVEPVAQAIEELWEQMGIDTHEVYLGIVNQNLLIKLVDLPKLPKNKISQALHWQIGNYIPAPTEDWVYDFVVVKDSGTKDNQMQVLLSAVKSDLLENTLQAAQKADLTVRGIEPISLSLLRLVPQEWRWTNFLLANMAEDLTTLMLTQEGVPYAFRILPHSFSDSEEFRQAVNTFLTDQDSSPQINALLLSGQGAKLTTRPQYLQDKLSIKTMVLDPWIFLQMGKENTSVPSEDMRFQGPDYAAVVSIAMGE